jgi:hypothetical protein
MNKNIDSRGEKSEQGKKGKEVLGAKMKSIIYIYIYIYINLRNITVLIIKVGKKIKLISVTIDMDRRGLVVRVPGCRSRRPGSDSRRFQIF